MPTEQPTKRTSSISIGTRAESGDETCGVGTIWSVRQPCRGVSRLASTLGWPVREVVQPLRWWLSSDTAAMWLDRCREDVDHPREVIEAALAHVVRNRVEAAYARSDLFERRRTLMDDWARYLAQGMGGTIERPESR